VTNYIVPTMARRVLKAVSGAIAVALAERPELNPKRSEVDIHEHSQPQAQNVETLARSGGLAFCCLKAEMDSSRKKQKLSIDFMVPETTHPDPYKCDLTSTIRIDACTYQGQEGVEFGLMQVWPRPDGNVQAHDCEQKCKADMERYPKYHERLISQAESDKAVEDANRTTARVGYEKAYAEEMYQIHKTYKEALLAAARQATTATKTSIDTLSSSEKSDATELNTDFKSKMQELEKETNQIKPTKENPDEDITKSNTVNELAITTEAELEASVAAHNKSLLDLLSTMKTEVNSVTSEFKETFDKLNGERKKDETQSKETLDQRNLTLNNAAQAEQSMIDQLKQEREQKAPQEPVLAGTDGDSKEEKCSSEECCCTIKLAENEAKNVKVATNFLNWDICQFSGELKWKTGLFGLANMGTQCKNGFFEDCGHCNERPACQKKGDCARAAKVTEVGKVVMEAKVTAEVAS